MSRAESNTKWTDARCAEAIAILRRCRTIEEACEKIGDAVGFEVTDRSLGAALPRHAGTTWGAQLGVDLAAELLAARMESDIAPTVPSMRAAEVVPLPDDSGTTATVTATMLPPPRPSDPELSQQDLAAHRLRNQVAELEAKARRLLKDLADREEQIAALHELRGARPLAPIVERHIVGATQRQGVPVMLCSDWHVEEPVELEKVNGLNEYNLDIAERCIDRMADAFEWMLRDKRYDCREGVVWLGGDLYSGYIHEELQEGNSLSPVEAVIWLQERVERMLRKIAATTNLERILVPCNDGNHGRLTHKIRVSTRTANSLEHLLYKNLAGRLSDDKRFEFSVAEGEWSYLDVFDQTLAFTHGDSFRYQGGVGGISIPLRRGLNEMRKYRKVSHVSLGHFHQRSDFGDISVNGSMIGVNPYSMHIHASPEPRQQSWFMVDSKRGKSLSAPIWL